MQKRVRIFYLALILLGAYAINFVIIGETKFKSKTVVGGTHTDVSFDASEKPYGIQAHADDEKGWKIKTAKIDSSSSWTGPSTSTYDARTTLSIIGPEAFTCKLHGDLIPPPGPGSGPVDYSVTGKLSGTPEIEPSPTVEIPFGLTQPFGVKIDSTEVSGKWEVKSSSGGANPSQPQDGETATIGGTELATGPYSVRAKANGIWSNVTTVTVYGMDESQVDQKMPLQEEGSTYLCNVETDPKGYENKIVWNPGDNGNAIKTDSVGEHTLIAELGTLTKKFTVTVVEVTSVSGGPFPIGQPLSKSDFSFETNPKNNTDLVSSIVPANPPTNEAKEDNQVQAICGKSSATGNYVVFEALLVAGAEIVPIGETEMFVCETFPDGHHQYLTVVIDPEGDGEVIEYDGPTGVAEVNFTKASTDINDKKKIKAQTIVNENPTSEAEKEVLVAEVTGVFTSCAYVTKGASANLSAESNLKEEDSGYKWPQGAPIWSVVTPSDYIDLTDWTGKDGNDKDSPLSFTFDEVGTYTFFVECGSSMEMIEVNVIGVDLQIASLDEAQEVYPGWFTPPDGIVPITLTLEGELPENADATVTLDYSSNILLFNDPEGEDPAIGEWDASALPLNLYAMGFFTGKATLTLILQIDGKEVYDSVRLTVFKVDLVLNGVDEYDEVEPGTSVPLNNNDSDKDNIIDLKDDRVPNENETRELFLKSEPAGVFDDMKELGIAQLILKKIRHNSSTSGGNLSIWENSWKGTEADMTWTLTKNIETPSSVHVEGTEASSKSKDVSLILTCSGFGDTNDEVFVTVPKIDIDTKTPREAGGDLVPDEDEEIPGLILQPNEDCDGGLTDVNGVSLSDSHDETINGSSDYRDLSPLILRKLSTKNLPAFGKVYLKTSKIDGKSEALVRIFDDQGNVIVKNGDSPVVMDSDQAEALFDSLCDDKKIFYLEGVKTGQVKLTMEYYDYNNPKYAGMDEITVTVAGLNLQVDSNNDGEINSLDAIVEEDAPGAVLSVNDSDKDRDMIPDYADGFSCWNEVPEDDNGKKVTSSFGYDFNSMLLTIPDFVKIENTKIRFKYSASVPQAKTSTNTTGGIIRDLLSNNRTLLSTGQPENIYKYTISKYLRIWTKNEYQQRNGDRINDGGDFIPDFDEEGTTAEISASNLGFTEEHLEQVFYLEAVKGRSRGINIVVELVETLDDGKTRTLKDTVKVIPLDPEMLVDGNWDGKLDKNDVRDKSLEFWINNDEDGKHWTDAADEYPDPTSNYWAEDDALKFGSNNSDNNISCLRDLEDFNRIQFRNLNPAIDLRDTYGIDVKCYLGTNGSSFPIRLFSSYDNKATTEYLRKEIIGNHQMNMNALAIPTVEKSLEIFHDKNFIFEGLNTQETQLALYIKVNNVTVRDIVNLDLKSPVEFCTRQNDALKYAEDRDLIVFVHGMNVDEYTFRRWRETVYKRLRWCGYRGRVCGVFWENFGFLKYNTSEQRSWEQSSALASFLQSMTAKYNIDGKSRVNVLAHSQGNVITGEAIRLAPKGTVRTYMAMQAAIPGHVYGKFSSSKCEQIVQTPNNPNVYKCYSSGASPDLPYLNGNANKLSKMVNCFNYDDFALLAWQVNNFIKPANRYGYYYTPKYDFCTGYEDPGDGSTDTMFFLERNLHFPGDRYEIFAHAAQSWGNALGTGVVKGFSRSVNLKNAYNFDPADSHLYHSWQFRQTNHETRIFWNMVRKQCLN